MDSQYAVDAADHPANHATDNSPDRSGRLAAHICPMRDPVRNALRLRRQRTAEQRGDNARTQKMWFHDRALSFLLLLGIGGDAKSRPLRGIKVTIALIPPG